jgi:hypothetical protein
MSDKTFKIQNAEGGTIEIPAGEYYFNTKARARRMMKNSLSPEARRVYACLELATMGFQQELAVIAISKDQTRPITRSDIAKQTGFSEPHVRRSLVELEEQGLAERRGTDDGPLHKGKVEIYSWAVPREPKPKKGSQRAAPIPEWFPQSWKSLKPLITRWKLAVSIEKGAALGSLLQAEGSEVAEAFQKAEDQAKEFLGKICARQNGHDIPTESGGGAPPENPPEKGVCALGDGVSALGDGVSAPENGVSAAPENGRIREITERTKQQQQDEAAAEDVVVVVEKVKAAGVGWVGKPAAQKILDDSRKLFPDSTAEEVAAIAAHVAPKINTRTQRNPEGALIKAVPLKLKEYRETVPGPQPTKEQKAILDAQAVLADPANFDAESIKWAEDHLSKLNGRKTNSTDTKAEGVGS